MNQLLQFRLALLHRRLVKQFFGYSAEELCAQYHPELSQLGWHLAHIAFIEQYWLREIVLGDDSRTANHYKKFFPEMIQKSSRGSLPEITDLSQLQNDFLETEKLFSDLSYGPSAHHLLKDDYIGWFLLQHGEQHFETMQMALFQKALLEMPTLEYNAKSFDATKPALPGVTVPGGYKELGSDHILACDNEGPVHEVYVVPALIGEMPVTNAEYLGFICADGYLRREFWATAGWQWNLHAGITAPEFWRQDEQGSWCRVLKDGVASIDPDAPVTGLSWYEADAYARYAGCRLPHEHEWECVMKADICEHDSTLWNTTGQTWEWCANTFYPYNGFQAFPYERYSRPWFDENHYTLKGGSPFTGKAIRRPSFRNFYQPDKRHIFAGVRLASDT